MGWGQKGKTLKEMAFFGTVVKPVHMRLSDSGRAAGSGPRSTKGLACGTQEAAERAENLWGGEENPQVAGIPGPVCMGRPTRGEPCVDGGPGDSVASSFSLRVGCRSPTSPALPAPLPAAPGSFGTKSSFLLLTGFLPTSWPGCLAVNLLWIPGPAVLVLSSLHLARCLKIEPSASSSPATSPSADLSA